MLRALAAEQLVSYAGNTQGPRPGESEQGCATSAGFFLVAARGCECEEIYDC